MILDDGPCVMRLIKLDSASPEGQSTEHDGRFLKEYDPTRRVANTIQAHLVTTHDPREAQLFSTPIAAVECYRQVAGSSDPRPDRQPLAAYTVELLRYSEAVAHDGV